MSRDVKRPREENGQADGSKSKAPKLTAPAGTSANSPSGSQYKQLNVKDALAYLDQVKQQFARQPEVYNQFLDIMRDFKSGVIDTPGVIQRVSNLFSGHRSLILGFNTFLPPGYKIEFEDDGASSSASSGPRMVVNNPNGSSSSSAIMRDDDHPSEKKKSSRSNIDFDQAIAYVTKIRERFTHQPDTYRQFLSILHTYQKEQTTIKKVYEQVAELFKDHHDLLDEFNHFLPNPAASRSSRPSAASSQSKAKKPKPAAPAPPATAAATVAASQRASREERRRQEEERTRQSQQKEKRKTRDGKASDSDDAESDSTRIVQWFDRVKRGLKQLGVGPAFNATIEYAELIKAVTLFAQGIVSRDELINWSRDHLRNLGAEVYNEFKKLLTLHPAGTIIVHAGGPINSEGARILRAREEDGLAQGLASVKAAPPSKYGPSYRALPKNFPQARCSGRDESLRSATNTVVPYPSPVLCLNDELVSVPTGSEETTKEVYRKTQYDEILYQCEDDRCELDIVIEQNASTIRFLEPLNERLNNAGPEEALRFKMDNLKDIHRASISRIYGDRGNDVLDGLRRNPSVAIPIILRRLKQKDEEWCNARRELNKFWREVYEKNHQRMLDSASTAFKQQDKKLIQPKSILTEGEQKRFSTGANNNANHQIIRALSMAIARSQCDEEDVSKIEQFWNKFVIPFFALPSSLPSSLAGVVPAGSPAARTGSSSSSAAAAPSSQDFTFLEVVDQQNRVVPPVREQQQPEIRNSKAAALLDRRLAFVHPTTYVLLRLYQIIYDRIDRARELCALAANQRRGINRLGKELSGISLDLNTPLSASLPDMEGVEGVGAASSSSSSSAAPAIPAAVADAPAPVSSSSSSSDAAAIPASPPSLTAESRFANWVVSLAQLMDPTLSAGPNGGTLDIPKYEEECRNLMSATSHTLYTIDKVFSALVRQAQSVVSCETCHRLTGAFELELSRGIRTPSSDLAYHTRVLELIGKEELCFRADYHIQSGLFSLRVSSISETEAQSEEDAREYNNAKPEAGGRQYVQSYISTPAEIGQPGPSKVFLHRNLKEAIKAPFRQQALEDAVIVNGLELNVDPRTHKVVFAEETEDILLRRSPLPIAPRQKEAQSASGPSSPTLSPSGRLVRTCEPGQQVRSRKAMEVFNSLSSELPPTSAPVDFSAPPPNAAKVEKEAASSSAPEQQSKAMEE